MLFRSLSLYKGYKQQATQYNDVVGYESHLKEGGFDSLDVTLENKSLQDAENLINDLFQKHPNYYIPILKSLKEIAKDKKVSKEVYDLICRKLKQAINKTKSFPYLKVAISIGVIFSYYYFRKKPIVPIRINLPIDPIKIVSIPKVLINPIVKPTIPISNPKSSKITTLLWPIYLMGKFGVKTTFYKFPTPHLLLGFLYYLSKTKNLEIENASLKSKLSKIPTEEELKKIANTTESSINRIKQLEEYIKKLEGKLKQAEEKEGKLIKKVKAIEERQDAVLWEAERADLREEVRKQTRRDSMNLALTDALEEIGKKECRRAQHRKRSKVGPIRAINDSIVVTCQRIQLYRNAISQQRKEILKLRGEIVKLKA